MEKLLIAGIDPGTIIAYCVLDLEGNVINIGSGRHLSHGELMLNVARHGKVFAVGSDVHPCPGLNREVARKLGAKIISPDHNLNYLEKIKIVDNFLKTKKEWIKISNKHEKDALAAALYTLKKVNTLIKKIDDHLKQTNIKHLHEEVKRKVLLNNIPITDAVKLFS